MAEFGWLASPLTIQGTKHAAYHVGPGLLGIGCEVHSLGWWAENLAECGQDHSYTAEEFGLTEREIENGFANYIGRFIAA